MPESFLVHEAAVQGPATHALVVGVGAYPHLNGGSGRLSEQHDGMAQLTSPPLSARAFASWLLSEFKHPHKPLGSVALLLSESAPAPFAASNASVNPFSAPVADSANVRRATERFFRLGNEKSR